MAIDTQNKRRSALRSVLPVASGTIAAADRRHAIRLYRFGGAAVAIEYETATLIPRFNIGVLPERTNTAALRPRPNTSTLRTAT